MRWTRVVALLLLVPAVAAAAPSSADQAEAKRLFEEGKEAMSVGRFSEARGRFKKSLELVPKASAAFNLAVALRGMGQPKEAHDVLQALLGGKYGELPKERRGQVQSLADEARRDVARLAIAVKGAPRASVLVDGARMGDVRAGQKLTLDLNPGERVVTVSAKLRETVERRVTLAPGKAEAIEIDLPLSREARRATLVLVAPSPKHHLELVGIAQADGKLERRLDPGTYTVRITSDEGSRESKVVLRPATRHVVELDPPRADSMFSSPWFWTVTGAVVVGASVGGYFLLRPKTEDPVKDPVFGVTETLQGVRF